MYINYKNVTFDRFNEITEKNEDITSEMDKYLSSISVSMNKAGFVKVLIGHNDRVNHIDIYGTMNHYNKPDKCLEISFMFCPGSETDSPECRLINCLIKIPTENENSSFLIYDRTEKDDMELIYVPMSFYMDMFKNNILEKL